MSIFRDFTAQEAVDCLLSKDYVDLNPDTFTVEGAIEELHNVRPMYLQSHEDMGNADLVIIDKLIKFLENLN
jgi:hypothetical protein